MFTAALFPSDFVQAVQQVMLQDPNQFGGATSATSRPEKAPVEVERLKKEKTALHVSFVQPAPMRNKINLVKIRHHLSLFPGSFEGEGGGLQGSRRRVASSAAGESWHFLRYIQEISNKCAKFQQECATAVNESRTLRQKLQQADLAQQQATCMEKDYQQVISIMETELAESKRQLVSDRVSVNWRGIHLPGS